jgi:hypothetical protein
MPSCFSTPQCSILPIVLCRDEVSALLSQLHGRVWLMASLMYGAGLRLLECDDVQVVSGRLGTDRLARYTAATVEIYGYRVRLNSCWPAFLCGR